MAQVFREPDGLAIDPDLPALESLMPTNSTAKEKMDFVLRLLRQAAQQRRESKGRPFYSIRKVARHFSLPPTTVTRLYAQLKTEGVLGSIWGSKTIIEPAELDNDIRLKAVVGLPVSLDRFSICAGYRRFFWLMQRTLWKHRFGSQLIFHENGFAESPKFTDALLDYKADVIVWLMPCSSMSNTIARLNDRGIRSITITDGMPINGEPGYYVSRHNALMEGLSAWKISGIRSVLITQENQGLSTATQRMLHTVLSDIGLRSTTCDLDFLVSNRSSQRSARLQRGVIFTSAQSILQLVYQNVGALSNVVQQNRVMCLEGAVDLPIDINLSGSLDTIEFDWRTIARRVISDLVAKRGAIVVHEQAIFNGKWQPGNPIQKLQ